MVLVFSRGTVNGRGSLMHTGLSTDSDFDKTGRAMEFFHILVEDAQRST